MSITRVQKKQCYIASSGAFNVSQTAGNLIILEVQGYSYNGTPATITCTSTGSDTPIKATQALGPNYGAGKILWYIWDCEAGTPTYSVGGVPDDCSLTLYEYAGVDATADPLIDADFITNSSANPLGVSLTTEAGGLLFFSWGNEVSLSFSSMNSGATLITFDTGRYMADAENLNTSAGSTTVDANVSSDVDNMIVAASFRAAGGGGGDVTATPNPCDDTDQGIAPTASVTNHVFATPNPCDDTDQGIAPTAAVTNHVFAEPNPCDDTDQGITPTASVTNHVFATPNPCDDTDQGIAPTASVTGHQFATPNPCDDTDQGIAPNASVGNSVYATPAPCDDTDQGTAPTASVTNHVFATPNPCDDTDQGIASTASVTNHVFATPAACDDTDQGIAPTAGVTAHQFATPNPCNDIDTGIAPDAHISGTVYAGTLYKCVGGVLVISDLPAIYNNKNIAGQKLYRVVNGELVLIHTASW